MTEYQGLQLENQTNYKTSKNTDNLTILLSKYFQKEKSIISHQIKQAVSLSSNPVELLKNLKLN